MAHDQDSPDRPQRSSNLAVFDRISKVEGDVAQVREQIAGMNVNLTSQGQTLTRIAMTLDQRGATDWKAIWSAASVMLALIALGASLILSPIRQQMDTNRLAIDEFHEREMMDSRDQLKDSEERGRYKERVDRIDRELQELEDEVRGAK